MGRNHESGDGMKGGHSVENTRKLALILRLASGECGL